MEKKNTTRNERIMGRCRNATPSAIVFIGYPAGVFHGMFI